MLPVREKRDVDVSTGKALKDLFGNSLFCTRMMGIWVFILLQLFKPDTYIL